MRKKVKVAQSCPTFCDPMDYSLPGSVHGDLPNPGMEPRSLHCTGILYCVRHALFGGGQSDCSCRLLHCVLAMRKTSHSAHIRGKGCWTIFTALKTLPGLPWVLGEGEECAPSYSCSDNPHVGRPYR